MNTYYVYYKVKRLNHDYIEVGHTIDTLDDMDTLPGLINVTEFLKVPYDAVEGILIISWKQLDKKVCAACHGSGVAVDDIPNIIPCDFCRGEK